MDTAIETPAINSVTNPANSNMDSTRNATIADNDSKVDMNPYRDESNSPNNGNKVDTDKQNETATSTDTKNDSSTLSTAFTISFEDDSNSSKKLFGIRDSIRKFAPPKPLTVEKPRPPKSDQGQDSLVSIESAPAGFIRHSSHRELSNSSRASSRKSNSSRHSNISESAAFLIDKMLNNKQQQRGEDPNLVKAATSHIKQATTSTTISSRATSSKKQYRDISNSAEMMESEVDFVEDKSDNGTYIVGTDPESEAARKKIDELFGVVKAAEASLLAKSKALMDPQRTPTKTNNTSTRQSRPTDKKQSLSKERQEHLARLAYRKSPASRSSSSSRQDNIPPERKTRAGSRHSRHSSCDRTPKAGNSRPKRSASQSSRQSSHKELSDGDTRSSRSSLHNGVEQEISLSSLPSMKFNRAFALRRARLGLGEPRVTSTPNYVQDPDSLISVPSNQRRQGASTVNNLSYKTPATTTNSASFCRDDGGRFSLRMKNNIPHRPSASRLAQLESYNNKVSNIMKVCGESAYSSLSNQQQQLPKNPQTTPNMLPFQSSDESHEAMSPFRYKMLAHRLQRKRQPSEAEADIESYRMNYSSLNQELENNSYSLGPDGRGCGRRNNPSLQLGALDSLVISAVSSLSMKLRHSICDILIEHAKKLPIENETRLIVEEILPQLTADSLRCKSPTSIEEIDQSLYFDLAKTLKNLKKIEQMVDVINLISKDITMPDSPTTSSSNFNSQATGAKKTTGNSASNSDANSANDLSPV